MSANRDVCGACGHLWEAHHDGEPRICMVALGNPAKEDYQVCGCSERPPTPHLFIRGPVQLHSGRVSDLKIECDALTDEDWQTIAYLIQKRVRFREVCGVPTGGVKLAEALRGYADALNPSLPWLVVDDVLTTGASIEEYREYLAGMRFGPEFIGYVVFARGDCPDWVQALFRFNG